MRWASGRLIEWVGRLAPNVRRYGAIILIVLAAELLVDIVNPFGIQGAIKAKAVETLQLVTAPFYNWGHETAGQKVVTVVLIDQAYFDAIHPDRRDAVWPMPVNLLTRGVIQRIVEAQPAALFIDIGFPDAPREVVDGGVNSRSEALEKLGGNLNALPAGPRVFLGDSLSPSAQQREANKGCAADFVRAGDVRGSNIVAGPLLDQLFRDSSKARLELVDASWSGDSVVYPLAPAMTGEGNCRSLQRSGEGNIASPALALFKAYADRCQANPKRICFDKPFARLRDAITVADPAPSSDGFRTYKLDRKAQGDLALRWGVRLSGQMERTFKNRAGADACFEQFYASSAAPLINYVTHLFGPLQKQWGEPTHRRCVYIDTISAADLLDRRRFAGGEGAPDPAAIEAAFLKDRVVLLGVDLPQAGDKFMSPINGAIPGVYLHAAAVENLITYGDGYHTAEIGPPWRVAMIALVALLTFAMAWIWDWLCRVWSRFAPGWGPNLLAPLTYIAAMFAVGSVVILALSATDLPLTEIVVPIVALHVILFSGLIENWKRALRTVFAPEPVEEPETP